MVDQAAFDRLQQQVADLAEAVQDLLTEQEEEEQEPPNPTRWSDRATQEDRTALIGWVDRLNRSYSLRSDFIIPPCWPAHPGLVEELAAVWRAWIVAALHDEAAGSAGSTALTTWHDTQLWPVLRRLKENNYNITNCRSNGHQVSPLTAAATDLTLVP